MDSLHADVEQFQVTCPRRKPEEYKRPCKHGRAVILTTNQDRNAKEWMSETYYANPNRNLYSTGSPPAA